MTRLVCISDTHCHDLTELKLPEGDLLVHAGDLTYRGDVATVGKVMAELKEVAVRYPLGVVLIAGNHDWLFETSPGLARSMVPEGVHYLNDQEVEIDGLRIWGSPVQPEFGNWAFNRRRGPEINRHWVKIPAGIDILVTHGPPFGILDKSDLMNEHAGCNDLLDHIVNRVRPQFHIFGHIHECHGIETKGKTTFVNAAILDDYYNIAFEPIVLEIK